MSAFNLQFVWSDGSRASRSRSAAAPTSFAQDPTQPPDRSQHASARQQIKRDIFSNPCRHFESVIHSLGWAFCNLGSDYSHLSCVAFLRSFHSLLVSVDLIAEELKTFWGSQLNQFFFLLILQSIFLKVLSSKLVDFMIPFYKLIVFVAPEPKYIFQMLCQSLYFINPTLVWRQWQ